MMFGTALSAKSVEPALLFLWAVCTLVAMRCSGTVQMRNLCAPPVPNVFSYFMPALAHVLLDELFSVAGLLDGAFYHTIIFLQILFQCFTLILRLRLHPHVRLHAKPTAACTMVRGRGLRCESLLPWMA